MHFGKIVGRALAAAACCLCSPAVAAVIGPVVPSLFGVYDPGDGRAEMALWGYDNPNDQQVILPFGRSNNFLPTPTVRGQPYRFDPGNHPAAFVSSFDYFNGVRVEDEHTWRVTTPGFPEHTATASLLSSPRLPVDPHLLLGGALVPFVHRVWSEGPDEFYAEFGYINSYSETKIVPFGLNNLFIPAPSVRGQPFRFFPGIVESAFTIQFSPEDENLVWRLTDDGVERLAPVAIPVPEPGATAAIALAALAASYARRGSRWSPRR